MASFEIQARTAGHDSSITIVDLIGAVDVHTVPELDSFLKNLVNESKFRIILNFERLDYICSTGMGAIMGLEKELYDHNGRIVCLKAVKKVKRLLDILGFSAFFDIYNDETEAINSFF